MQYLAEILEKRKKQYSVNSKTEEREIKNKRFVWEKLNKVKISRQNEMFNVWNIISGRWEQEQDLPDVTESQKACNRSTHKKITISSNSEESITFHNNKM